MHVYGIKNCDTVKKALNWLATNNVEYTFHDFKKEGVSADKLKDWEDKAGLDNLINRKGTTWRALSDEQKASVTDKSAAYKLMQENTSVIKRPVIESKGNVVLGFDEALYQKMLK